MVAKWLPGVDEILVDERIEYARQAGISSRVGSTYRVPGAPWRFAAHTMEAPANATSGLWATIAGLRGYIIRHRAPPHLWGWAEKDWVAQTVPLDLAAYALRHDGPPETNHVHAIQLELLGYANDRPYVRHADWIGRRIIAPLRQAGVPINLAHLAPSTGSDGYGTNGAVRMSTTAWLTFDGICGHANVPNNSHWDPGVADYARIARAADAGPTSPPPTSEEDDMPYLMKSPGRAVRVVVGDNAILFPTNEQLSRVRAAHKAAGIPERVVTYETDEDYDWMLRGLKDVTAEEVQGEVAAALPAIKADTVDVVRSELGRATMFVTAGRNNAVYDPSKLAWMADAVTLPQIKAAVEEDARPSDG